jgi:predicted phosphodiesterase
MRRLIPLLLVLLSVALSAAVEVRLPNQEDSLKMLILGDTGTGDDEQYEVGQRAAEAYRVFPYEMALMLGDNMYGSERPQDFVRKFERPYKPLLDAGVKFYAVLGNHDDREQRNYKLFNMNGELYYTFKAPRQNVRFYGLESSYMDQRQLEWLERQLRTTNEDWKIVFMHHPIYSSGERHGSSTSLRQVLEPLFLKYNVSLVLAGHEHFYERLKPQNGINYFTAGGSAKLRRGNIREGSEMTAKGFDTDRSFVIAEINGDQMHFQAISRQGLTVDEGVLTRRKADQPTAMLMPRLPWPPASLRLSPRP